MFARCGAAIVLALAACTGEETAPTRDPSVFLPRHSATVTDGPAARAEGHLRFAEGCLWLEQADGTRLLILWPSDAVLGMINSRPAVLGPGRVLLAETDARIALGGGEANRAAAEELVGPIPSRCAGDGFWIASTVATVPEVPSP
jgi:hypothetical protein